MDPRAREGAIYALALGSDFGAFHARVLGLARRLAVARDPAPEGRVRARAAVFGAQPPDFGCCDGGQVYVEHRG